jgi:hypothetical protein
MNEEWKNISGYEKFYQVSNLGNVRSIERTFVNSRGEKRTLASGAVKAHENSKGYLKVRLWGLSKRKSFYVHRLVGLAFVENIHNKEQINHIDGVKSNNKVENLEWATASENNKHAIATGLNLPPQAWIKINGEH